MVTRAPEAGDTAGADGWRRAMRLSALLGLGAVGALLLVLVPALDLTVAGWFYVPGAGFVLNGEPIAEGVHRGVQVVARALGLGLSLAFVVSAVRARRVAGLGSRQWLFLLAALIVGPGLVANALLKDHWGRARPSQVEQFGGARHFSPPLLPADQCDRNCSFVAGDAAFGFSLHAAGYVAPARRRRPLFLAGMAAGLLLGLMRIGMGGHFLSDVLFAGAFMVLTTAALHALFFGGAATARAWRLWLGGPRRPDDA